MDLIIAMLILVLLLFGAYLIYEFVYVEYKRKKTRQIYRVFLFEKVGKEYVFVGESTAQHKNDQEIGSYVLVRNNKVPIDALSNDECFMDNTYGKAFFLVKYGEQDYRPMVRLRGEEFFKWQTIQRQAQDEQGQPMFDKDGEAVIEEVKVPKPYKEPLGISQQDREAFRFNLNFRRKMQERYGKQPSFFEKYAIPIAFTMMSLILMMTFAYMTNKNSDTQQYIADTFAEESGAFIKATQEPTFVEGLVRTYEEKQINENGPPK